jgi:hypothetical protein
MSHVPLSRVCAAALLLLVVAGVLSASPKLSDKDRVRLAETFRLAEAMDSTLWPGWNRIPFPVLLVTDSSEFLIRHPSPDTSFTAAGYDSLLKSQVFARARQFPTSLMASFPFDEVPTTIIG